MARQYFGKNQFEKELIQIINQLSRSRSIWAVWQDLITSMACTFNLPAALALGRYEGCKKEINESIGRLGDKDLPTKALSVIVDALEDNPDQDFLGNIYMELGFGSDQTGQFFTPYNISRMIAITSLENIKDTIEEQGFASICDPCVGGGAMLIAAANELRRQDINYQQNVLFVGQDIDRTVGMMAYIQLSLLGCPGYIVIGDAITNPIVGNPLIPSEKEGQEFWYTPIFFTDIWNRKKIAQCVAAGSGEDTKN